MMFVDSVEIMLLNVLKEQFCLVLNQYVYVGDVSGDTSPIIWLIFFYEGERGKRGG